MRDIKFRGKRVDNGEWVYGGYLKYEHMGTTKHIIITDWAQVYVNSFEVDAETVGQYTGLKDKNGKEIYEGNIVRVFNRTYDSKPNNNQIKFINGCWKVVSNNKKMGDMPLFRYENIDIEIIGNIHEKPELLEVDNG